MGVDPVLRCKIWSTLRKLTADEGTTIVITTHYMEEAAKADRIGFLRAGRMLREGTPDEIKGELGSADLDVAFFRLCEAEERCGGRREEEKEEEESQVSTAEENAPLIAAPGSADHRLTRAKEPDGWSCFSALCFKNLLVLRRNVVFMAFQTVMPVITFLIFIACVGPPLRDLRLSVHNGEGDCRNDTELWEGCPLVEKGEMGLLMGLLSGATEPNLGARLSCRVLSQLDPDVFGSITYFTTISEAERSVLEGKSNAIIAFERDFSSSLAKRILSGTAFAVGGVPVKEEALFGGNVKVRLDTTDATVASSVRNSLVRSVYSFLVNYASSCDFSDLARLLRHSTGLDFGTTVQEAALGTQLEPTILSHDMLPGMMALILQMLAMALTSDLLIKEKEGGLLQRDLICGVSLTLALLANLLCMLVVVVFQIVFSVILLAIVSPHLDSGLMAALTLMFLLQALCGMNLGLIITAVCRTAEQAIQVSSTSILTYIICN